MIKNRSVVFNASLGNWSIDWQTGLTYVTVKNSLTGWEGQLGAEDLTNIIQLLQEVQTEMS